MKLFDDINIDKHLLFILHKNCKDIRKILEDNGLENFAEPKFDFQAFKLRNKEGEGYIRVDIDRGRKLMNFDIISPETLNYLHSLNINLIDCFDEEELFIKLVTEEVNKVKQL